MATHGARAKWEVMKLISRRAETGGGAAAGGVFILEKAGLGGNFVVRLLLRPGL